MQLWFGVNPLIWGDYPGLSGWSQWDHRTLISDRGGQRDIWLLRRKSEWFYVRRTWPALAGFYNGGRGHGPRNGGGSRSWERQEIGSFPRTSRKEGSPADTFILVQWDTLQTSAQQNWKIRNLCRFKSLSLWPFITAAIYHIYEIKMQTI